VGVSKEYKEKLSYFAWNPNCCNEIYFSKETVYVLMVEEFTSDTKFGSMTKAYLRNWGRTHSPLPLPDMPW